MTNYKELKSKIFWNNIKGIGGTASKLFFTTAGYALVGLGSLIVGLGNASHKGAEKAKTYSEEKFEEAKNLKKEGVEQKKKDNEEWETELKELKDESKVEEVEDGDYCLIS